MIRFGAYYIFPVKVFSTVLYLNFVLESASNTTLRRWICPSTLSKEGSRELPFVCVCVCVGGGGVDVRSKVT